MPPGEAAWLFPPPVFTGQVLAKLQLYRVNAILVIRLQRHSNEWLQLAHLPQAIVSEPFYIPKQASSCIPSLRVPPGALNPAYLGLVAVYIRWL